MPKLKRYESIPNNWMDLLFVIRGEHIASLRRQLSEQIDKTPK